MNASAPVVARRLARRIKAWAGRSARRQALVRPWIATLLPQPVRTHVGIDEPTAGPVRIEIGSGDRPTPGYVHVDSNPTARHLEFLAPAWDLPFPTETVDEILAVHVLEHVAPAAVVDTLREWRRVLRPGGLLVVHVPDAAAMLPAFLRASGRDKWLVAGAIFGSPVEPDLAASTPSTLHNTPAHQLLLDFELLSDLLHRAGFREIVDLSETITDHHTDAWRAAGLIPRLSLVAHARSPVDQA